MKNLFFSLAFLLVGTFGFASNNIEDAYQVKRVCSINIEKVCNTELVKFQNITEPQTEVPLNVLVCNECGEKGCCVLTVTRPDGPPSSREVCCKDIIVVKKPAILAEY